MGKQEVSGFQTQHEFADRVSNLPESFIREILKVTTRPEIISFAGGLPNPELFPVDEIAAATLAVLQESGQDILQYTVTEGYLPLKEKISKRYRKKKGLEIPPENILILSGSQQGLDLVGKAFLNPRELILLEKPTFIGALQSFAVFEPSIEEVSITTAGPDMEEVRRALDKKPKLFYCVPNFQNPTGATYSSTRRNEIAQRISGTNTVIVEDDPYGDISFTDEEMKSFWELAPEQTILLGSFSKIISPGLRTGWLAAPSHLIRKLVVLKQAADTHTNHLSQRAIDRYLSDNNIDLHISKIKSAYKAQRDCMVDAIRADFPSEVKVDIPNGGMFLWATLPENVDAYEVFESAIKEKVAFVPAKTFYANLDINNTIRLNFSNCSEEQIREGIRRLGFTLKKFV